jgi:glycosyltransferase involved in cell wall biosynthesis
MKHFFSAISQRPNAGPSMSVVVNTYEQPEYLRRVLLSLENQLIAGDEILIADDGSGSATREVVNAWKTRQSFRVEHVWEEHQGFRRSRILNAAIARTQGEYLIFLDGDSVPHPQFIADHRRVARKGYYIQGHRVCFTQPFSRDFAVDGKSHHLWSALFGNGVESGGKFLFRWPIPILRGRTDLRGVRGCNLAIWRADLVRVNGYNEAFEGWGREDSELALRLMNSGVQWLDVRGWAVCYHLWHPPADRSQLDKNIEHLDAALARKSTTCEKGLNLHLAENATRTPQNLVAKGSV